MADGEPRGFTEERVCAWIIDLLNVQDGDELVDLFPGTGAMGTTRQLIRQAPTFEFAEDQPHE